MHELRREVGDDESIRGRNSVHREPSKSEELEQELEQRFCRSFRACSANARRRGQGLFSQIRLVSRSSKPARILVLAAVLSADDCFADSGRRRHDIFLFVGRRYNAGRDDRRRVGGFESADLHIAKRYGLFQTFARLQFAGTVDIGVHVSGANDVRFRRRHCRSLS